MLLSQALGIPEPRKLSLPLIRQSSVTARETCPIKGAFVRMGVRSYGRSEALDTGSYAHLYVKERARGSTHADAISSCSIAFDALLADIAKHPASAGSVDRIPPEIVDDHRKDLNKGIVAGMIAWEPLEKAINEERLFIDGSELSGTVKLPLPSLGGKRVKKILFKYNLDLRLRKPDGTRWIWDLKTMDASMSMSDVFANALRRIQTWGYLFAHNEDRPDEKCSGFMYHGVKKVTIVQKKRSNQSLDDYLAECLEWYRGTGRHADKAEDRKNNPPSQILPLYMCGEHFQEIPTVIARRIWNTHLAWKQTTDESLYEPHESACNLYGGCTYARFCNEPKWKWPKIFAESFTTDPDPLDSDPTRHLDNR